MIKLKVLREQSIPGTKSYSYSENAVTFLKKAESFSERPYTKNKDRPTIGYGTTFYPNNKPVTIKDPPITEEQADQYLRDYMNKIMKSINKYLKNKELNQNQLDALVIFGYNIGSSGLLNSSVFTLATKSPNNPQIKNEFMKYATFKGQQIPGLVNRRKAEIDLYFSPSGVDLSKEKSIY